MKRILMQVYIKNSVEAVEMYRKAFGCELGYHVKNDNGSYYHSEMDIGGAILSVAERPDEVTEAVTGNTMQFCLEFGEGREEALKQAYQVLQEGAQIAVPLGACEYSAAMADLTDRFGVRWCLFI